MSSTPFPIIDQSVVDQVVSDTGIEILPLLIDSYLEESTTRLGNMAQAVEKGDAQTLEFEVHTLGSTSLAIGVEALGRLSRQIEHLCLEGKHDEAFALYPQVTELAEQSRSALQTLKQGL
ncbi:Hpt domain-containing protein [Vibrio astriarenae]|jgi:HPt (histidine-containing phosphotransfer) domain-containing protein|uniref:Hpt domain-containing protein n=1 Tax=Vibrio agarivorans TaxID=153622 RepID=A0ABT7XYQ6_9VIBR|nr:Hpt domain-containing protein [Vibrio agarivorans]MDN2480887.1 Hpt domain-containing protein [Vibrio agarivorans]